MTEDVRDAAREPKRGAETPADAAAVTPEEGGAEAVEFAAETMNAERLGQGPEAPDYKDRWLRAEAELQNSRRRAARDLGDAVRSAEDRILVELIELLDDLERALAALAPAPGDEAWAHGVSLSPQRTRAGLAPRALQST